jgi:hypothetical protein
MKTHEDYKPFRQSMAKVLLTKSAATLKHQLDGGEHKHSRSQDNGTVMHQLVLGGRWYETLSYPNYRTKEAQERRDDCHKRGITPVLKHEIEPFEQFAGAVKLYLLDEFGVDLSNKNAVAADEYAIAERRVEWTHRVDNADGSTFRHLRCEGTPDLVCPPRRIVFDLKFGEGMSQEDRERQVYSMAYDVQAAAYLEAIERAPDFARDDMTSYGECEFPYKYVLLCGDPETQLITHHELSEAFLAVGKDRWSKACDQYARCVDSDVWLYYPSGRLYPPPKALNGLFGAKGFEQ